MPSTRRSTRLASSSSPSSSQANPAPTTNGNGVKRKASTSASQDSPSGKKGRPNKSVEKEQKTIEQTMDVETDDIQEAEDAKDASMTHDPAKQEDDPSTKENGLEDSEIAEAEAEAAQEAERGDKPDVEAATTDDTKGKTQDQNGEHQDSEDKTGGTSSMDFTGTVEQSKEGLKEQDPKPAHNGAIEEPKERGVPSSILEKGLIYFFVRGRVGIDSPEGVQDIARSHIVLRPLPHGAKLGSGALEDLKNNRLLALPKKVLPKSHRDTFMSFVEKGAASIDELKEDFMKGSSYDTKTTGVRHTPPVTPIAEGIYAITTTGRSSHLVYMLTVPSELGEVQKEMGLMEKGSFVTSVKNPEQKGPANATLDQAPDFPKEFMEEFRQLRWMPLQPKHLNYANAQFLLIGEGYGDVGNAVEPSEKDQKHDKETPLEEMEKLEKEDEERVQGLKDDDPIFADLGLSHKEFSGITTTW